ncbi:TonB-dependent siderophore receptor [Pseudomonas aegrilactucae]|uniref:TonB-dependent siderophore receptor n=1 Tax=Pseudomonas aegrilactucae TaxID=2854028 RepID=A0A9Q2XKT5_9PSED|nr:TonB-dependent siderophore receptor [Pseudomonas aegrilactucae]MBV6288758.1 TonB-dependent siderophore receptor [Pseudomonas aegrilactucae]
MASSTRKPPLPSPGGLLLATRLTLGGLCLGLPALACAEQQVQAYDIPAGPLEQVLGRYAQAADAPISFQSRQVAGLSSPGVRGTLSVLEGFAQVLRGTPLTVRYSDGGYSLERLPAQSGVLEVEATSVTAQQLGSITEGTGSYTTGSATIGGKTEKTLRETPQSVSVITRQRMEDQGLNSLTQVLDQTTGITLVGGNDASTSILSRGFAITSIQTDGGAPAVRAETYQTLPDMTAYDHVEVLRGSDGLYGGTGEPGGSINLVRKRALGHNQLKISQSAGSWNSYRTEVDVTGPLGFDGQLRGRVAMSYEDKDYFYKGADSEKHVVFGTLEADLTPDTLLTLGGTYEWRDMDGYWDGGLPRYSDGKSLGLSRRTSLAADWSSNDYKRTEGFIKLDHRFNDDWKINASYTKARFDTTEDIGQVTGAVDPLTGAGAQYARFIRGYSNDQDLVDTNVQGRFEAFGLQHEVLFGADYSELDRSYSDHSDQTFPFSVVDGDAGALPKPAKPPLYYESPTWNMRKSGAYATLKAQLAEPLKLTVGARYSDYSDVTRTIVPSFGSDRIVAGKDSGVITPYGGLVYDLTEQWSLYTSYAEIYLPQTAFLDAGFNGLKPITGQTYEFGTKGELLDGRLNLSTALYYTKRENEAVRVFAGSAPGNDANCCYAAIGQIISKGIDSEISGELAPGWQATAGYTLNINRQRTASDPGNSGKPISTQTPKHLFKFFTTYQLPAQLERWKVGLGAVVQSETYKSGNVQRRLGDGSLATDPTSFSFTQSGYAVWNSLVEYRIDDHWTATVNANNLFDKTYYQTVDATDSRNWYGAPRNYMLTLRGTF